MKKILFFLIILLPVIFFSISDVHAEHELWKQVKYQLNDQDSFGSSITDLCHCIGSSADGTYIDGYMENKRAIILYSERGSPGLSGYSSDKYILNPNNLDTCQVYTTHQWVGPLGPESDGTTSLIDLQLCKPVKADPNKCCCQQVIDRGTGQIMTCTKMPKDYDCGQVLETSVDEPSTYVSEGCDADTSCEEPAKVAPRSNIETRPLFEGSCDLWEKTLSAPYSSTATLKIGDLTNLRSLAKPLNKLFGGLSGTDGINKAIGRIIQFLMVAIGSLLLLFYVYAGFLWMTAGGNAENITKAKSILMWTTLSIVAQFSAYWLVLALFGLFQ